MTHASRGVTLPSGKFMSSLGLGTWKSSPGEVGNAVKEAIRLGYRHIDCAAIYGNEKEIGQALQECFKESIVVREDLFITSKLWNAYHHPDDVEDALRHTLQDLNLDYLDLYLVHWPIATNKDSSADDPPSKRFFSLDDMPLSATWGALEKCVDKGLAKDIGLSNCSAKKIAELLRSARIPPAVDQVERHPYLQQGELLKFCSKNNIHVTGYSGLGSGDRPSSFKRHDEPNLLEDEAIGKISHKHNVTPAQILLKWAVQSGASTIPKSTSHKRLAENLQSQEIELEDDDMEQISKLDRHRRYIDGDFFCQIGSPYSYENLWDEEKL